MARPTGHVKTTGSDKQLIEARLWNVYSAAVRLVDSSKMVGRLPPGGDNLFAAEPGALLALATRCDTLRTVLKRKPRGCKP